VAPATDSEADNKKYAVDEKGFIRNWLALPVIPLNEAQSHSEAQTSPIFAKEFFAGQKTATPAPGSKVIVDGNELVWSAVQLTDFQWNLGGANNAIAFGITYVVCEQDMTNVVLAIGSDDSSFWKLNGVEVIKICAGRGVTPDSDKSQPLALKQGVNALSMAVINGSGGFGACARFLDTAGNAVTNLTIALVPRQAPMIVDAGVFNITAKSATVRSHLKMLGTAEPAVFLLHGPTDGGTNRSAWANEMRLPGPPKVGPQDIVVTHNASDAVWLYRLCATNRFGESWTQPAGSFLVGAVQVQASGKVTTEGRPAAFVISRPPTATNGPLAVNYVLGGVAVNGMDYDEIENPAVIPAGATELQLPIVPCYTQGAKQPKVVEFSLAPGGYLIGPANKATMIMRPTD
jgi:hypothetical protein